MVNNATRLRAVQMLVLATGLWGLSFPTMKALAMTQDALLPGRGTWFFSALCMVVRFGAAAVVMLLLSARTLRKMTRLEITQGAGLGLFGGLGMLLQMDGLAYTSASTSAFLTQCYCLILPIWVAVRDRRWPTSRVLLASILVITGVAILARVDWRDLRLGRGELETILASLFFTGQILWLERPSFAANRAVHFSLVMFATATLVCLPIAALTTQQPKDWLQAYSTAPTIGFIALLVIFSTLGAYLIMNRWQRFVGATLAGLLYCIEPVFASAFALFLPGWFSAWAGVNYANETVTTNLLLGGGLITAANVLVQLSPPASAEPSAQAQHSVAER